MFRRIALFTSLLALASFGGFAQTNEATGTATVTILSGISIANTQQLSFGSILGGYAGTMAVGAAPNPVTPTYGGSLTSSQVFGTPYSAAFTVSGDGGKTFAVTGLTGGTGVALTRSGGTETISVSLTAPACAGGTCQLSGTTGSTGTLAVYVGGTLTLAGTELAGLYENAAAYTLTVNYN